MNLSQNIRDLLEQIGAGQMQSTAYDTAWIARLSPLGVPIGKDALDWLREHQLSDGSWGAESPAYYHDRLVCTLAAAIALKTQGNASDIRQLQYAKDALETVIPKLADQAGIETIGFEMILPTLFDEAEALGIIQRRDYADMSRLNQQRAAKLAALPGGLINRFVTLAFSAEMAGSDGLRLLDVERLQEANGSVGHSPSATAYFVLNVRPADPAALAYLVGIPNPDGGIPDVAPFDVFEPSWTLWNMALFNGLDGELKEYYQPHLDFLSKTWKLGTGVAYAAGYTPKDADVTSVTHEVLNRYGRVTDIEAVLSYEVEDYFRCYALEANPSVSTNIHALGALRHAGFALHHNSVQKVVRFLESTQFWFDKWHVSPYYPTSHAIIACAGYADELVEDAISWILSSQNPDGSWGYFVATAEETAYCLQALVSWRQCGHPVPTDVLHRGSEWLMAHADPPYPALWIGKCLYSPVFVIRSTVLSALALVRQELGSPPC